MMLDARYTMQDEEDRKQGGGNKKMR